MCWVCSLLSVLGSAAAAGSGAGLGLLSRLATILVVAGAVLLLCLALLQQTAIQLLDACGECTTTWCAERGQWRRLNQCVLLAWQRAKPRGVGGEGHRGEQGTRPAGLVG